ncbi:MAG TPA: hypothetical protein VLT88_03565, partial [Desulfosarcina sp.]|nr:hypothetical protein [Desulfosarcina sp.]
CLHAPTPYLPRDWPRAALPLEALEDESGRPVLQVVIAYNVYWPNHTALRLVDAAGRTLFWDPGGGYGKSDPLLVRHNDLIRENAPDLPRYLAYRWANNDQAVEIFEWRLPAAEVQRLAAILSAGAGRSAYTDTGFRTATPGFFCNAAISGFLYDYGQPVITPGDAYFFPGLLSRELYRSRPDRVMILEREQRGSVLILMPRPVDPNLADRRG